MRFNSSHTLPGFKPKRIKVVTDKWERWDTTKIPGDVPRLSCGTRDCELKTENGNLKIIKWSTCDTQGSIKQGTPCGNLFIDFEFPGNYKSGAVGFRNSNMNNFDTFIYNPWLYMRRKKSDSLEIMGEEPPMVFRHGKGTMLVYGARISTYGLTLKSRTRVIMDELINQVIPKLIQDYKFKVQV